MGRAAAIRWVVRDRGIGGGGGYVGAGGGASPPPADAKG